MVDAFTGMGLSDEAARVAAVGRNSEQQARAACESADQINESRAVTAKVIQLATGYRAGDPTMAEQQARDRACGQVRAAFAGTPHAARVAGILREQFPQVAPTGGRSAPTALAALREARRRGVGVRVVDSSTRRPTGEVLTATEIDRLIGGAS
jgi:hypothetical protein